MKLKSLYVASFVVLASQLILPSQNAVAALKYKEIPSLIITTLIQKELKGIRIRLNNFGPKRGYSWYKGGDSYIKLPRNLGGTTQRFSFPALNEFPYRYYVNDMNSGRVKVTANPNTYFNLIIPFEDRGIEVKGMCSSKNVAKRALCIAGADKSAPDVHISGARVIISFSLKPSADRRSVTIRSMRARFEAKTVRIGKHCTLGQGICAPLGGLKRILEKEVSKRLVSMISNDRLYNAVANGLRPTVQKLGIRKVLGVWLRRGKLRVAYQ